MRLANNNELQKLIAIDDDASELYASVGLKLDLGRDHPFVVDEINRWSRAIEQRLSHVAVDKLDNPIGFAALGFLDGDPYLDQISVLQDYMQRGIGTLLLNCAIAWSGDRPLWLTTYSHLPWNRSYYEKQGFVAINEQDCGPELCAVLQTQRAALPDPQQRIAMVRRI
ncbi:Uncharacterised protein [Zhongshania aliphaticivorans]|uniref:N-acetyltransferase domain-containing protein n=1 Tax=Zhongshania aliphaticivorans TaxID=1470434 RepID=A0A5S9MXE5_9GAMM|nr:Uncharacterised protein [Zhongshania aliphaticivorans]CAA0084529.1 Uncharacterised protein [Zhongshania aliphaticivorans]